jgi:hypothetical protein
VLIGLSTPSRLIIQTSLNLMLELWTGKVNPISLVELSSESVVIGARSHSKELPKLSPVKFAEYLITKTAVFSITKKTFAQTIRARTGADLKDNMFIIRITFVQKQTTL